MAITTRLSIHGRLRNSCRPYGLTCSSPHLLVQVIKWPRPRLHCLPQKHAITARIGLGGNCRALILIQSSAIALGSWCLILRSRRRLPNFMPRAIYPPESHGVTPVLRSRRMHWSQRTNKSRRFVYQEPFNCAACIRPTAPKPWTMTQTTRSHSPTRKTPPSRDQ